MRTWLTLSDVANVLQSDEKELKEWTEIKLIKNEALETYFKPDDIAKVW